MAARRAQRVLMTTDTVGGVWSYAVELARALDQRGVRVGLATMGALLTPVQRKQLAGIASLTLFESDFRLEWMQQSAQDVARAGRWLLALEREYRPDLVHLNQFSFGALPFVAPTLVVAHSCVLSWWRAVHGQAAPKVWARYRAGVTQGLAGAGLVAAPTRAMLDSLAQNYGCSRGGLVLGNGRSPAQYRPACKQPVVLAAGRFWDAAKNLEALQVAARALSWPIRVAGSTSQPDGGTVLPAGVQCLGDLPPEALAAEMASAGIYALPARYEPFGLSVLEAGLSGCALVLGDIASLREIWGPAAVYVAPDDHDALRHALARLIARPADRTRLGAAARARAMHFTPARMADAYLDAYAGLHTGFAATEPRELLCAS
ncbi:MAG: a-glycosyltransferase, Glycosyltransferase Family 4-like protein [Ramlibacter sp.]|nr:a-glycosyltransferase, Glycosyltransferase Family 4-like protein [Ramlibacter sp.]